MKNYTQYVNVFQGCGETKLPEPSGIAASWRFIKGLAGNTHPGAVLPFGKYSCCLYTAGYPTGYSCNRINTGGSVEKLGNRLMMRGFSHFHQSGVGAIGVYYNYALTSPFYADRFSPAAAFQPREVTEEKACPGYYSARTTDVLSEVSVSDKLAIHRYTFEKGNGKIAIDFKNNGLYDHPGLRQPSCGKITQVSDTEFTAEMKLSGITLYFDVTCDARCAVSSFLWNSDGVTDGQDGCLSLEEPTDEPAGALFELQCAERTTAEIRLAVSLKSAGAASEFLRSEIRSFDEIRAAADEEWNLCLGRIETETDDPREKEIFYSNLYHSLTKPSDFGRESFIDGWGDHGFVTDVATMWDIYKTQLPLLFTLYPEISEKLLDTFLRFGQIYDMLPHCLLLSGKLGIESNQARMLSEHSIADAFFRGVRADYKTLLNIMLKDMQRPEYTDFFIGGGCSHATFTLDMAEACGAMTDVARQLGRTKTVALLSRYGKDYIKAFDKSTGLLSEKSEYYEGDFRNYSFRPLRHMDERIEICGQQRFVDYLDGFFGFTDCGDASSRFEGFNNETDMEAPYAYCYTDRHDRLCEIIDASCKYMFAQGRGGLPGNNDSGGLSSCYIWNVLGVFPVSGQDLMLIGTPRYKKTVLHLPGGLTFTIRKNGSGIYVRSASLDGQLLTALSFTASRMMQGGELTIETSQTPVIKR